MRLTIVTKRDAEEARQATRNLILRALRRNFAGVDLRDANLAYHDLHNINFTGANLSGVDFRGADLTGTNLTGADLRNAYGFTLKQRADFKERGALVDDD